nr:uncharacterized protein LOC109024250 [Gorilla gorilla gorilla]
MAAGRTDRATAAAARGSEVSGEGGKRCPSPRRRSPITLAQKLPHTHTPLLRSPGRAGAAPALLRSRAMQRPRRGGGEGEVCVTESGARAKRGHKQYGGHAVCPVSPFPFPLPWRLDSQYRAVRRSCAP